MNRHFPFSATHDRPQGDFGLVRREIDDLSRQAARALDATIVAFAEAIERRPVSLPELVIDGRFLIIGGASDPPAEWERFFVWKRQVLAYRFSSLNYIDERRNEVTHDVTLTTTTLAPSDWPEGLRQLIEGG